ncbi:hypothetical protein [Halomonas sp. BMC6]|uniref:hypothetical protein n=1 Tax=Halomonas sp. BMC6 TaxID=3073244 RepID=UPI0030D3F8C4
MSEANYTCRVKKVTQLAISRHGGTTYVTVDTFKGNSESRVNGGTIQISGDFGPWSHTWTHVGDGSFIDFLGKLNFDYAMNKLLGCDDLYVFDAEQTINGIRKTVLERRRENELTAEQAREYWDELANIDATTEREFFDSLNDISWYGGRGDFVSLTSALYDDDISQMPILTSPKGNTLYFWENLWPIVLVELRKVFDAKELAA